MGKKEKPKPRGVWKINPRTRVKPNKKKHNFVEDDICTWCQGTGYDDKFYDECEICMGTGLV